MSTVQRFETAAHVALLDAESGAGILVTPTPGTDLTLGGPTSLHAADWDAMVGPLIRGGWTFLADDWDLPVVVATLPDGRAVHGLYPFLVEQGAPPTAGEDRDYSLALLRLLDSLTDNWLPETFTESH